MAAKRIKARGVNNYKKPKKKKEKLNEIIRKNKKYKYDV